MENKLKELNKKNCIVFCHSYLDIVRTLNIAKYVTECSDRRTLILVPTQGLELYLTNVLSFSEAIEIRKLYIVKNIPFLKLVIEKLLQRIQLKYISKFLPANIIFSSRCYIEKEYYFINSLRNNCTLYYLHNINYQITLHKDKSILRKLKYRFLYGKGLSIMRNGEIILTKIDNSFLNYVYEYKGENFLTDIKRVSSLKSKFPYKYLFFSENILDFIYINLDEYYKVLQEVTKLISPEEFNKYGACKLHPRQKRDAKYVSFFNNEIPNYFSSQMADYPNCRLVVSFFSACLFDKYNNSVLRVSLLDLVSWLDNSKKQEYKKYLNDNSNDIFYPRTLDELADRITKEILHET